MRGSRPTAVRQTQYDYLWVIAAACPDTGAAAGIIMPHLDTATINLFLGEFSRQVAPDVQAVLIWDNAGHHVGGGLVVPESVSLIGLLPYSPELNPVENLWHYLRSHHWSNREYGSYQGLQEEAIRSVCAVCQDAEKLKAICNADYVKPRA